MGKFEEVLMKEIPHSDKWNDGIVERLLEAHYADIAELENKVAKPISETRYHFCACGDYIAEFKGSCKNCGNNLTAYYKLI